MTKIHSNALASIEFRLNWQSQAAVHVDCYFAPKVNFWRDFMPVALQEALMDKSRGDMVTVSLRHEDTIPIYTPQNIFTLSNQQFNYNKLRGRRLEPRVGRFYPHKFLHNLSGTVTVPITPFRCIGITENTLQVDFNHPLASRELSISARIDEVQSDQHDERGGRCNEWVEIITGDGVGFQTRYQDIPTDFFADDPFNRLDWNDDTEFYNQPRLVTHIDAKALEIITDFYAQFLQPGMAVLDLMSSWQSHLPSDIKFNQVIGLGMNSAELTSNPQLTHHLIQDLNKNPYLPIENEQFDVVVCTASVEYLIHPLAVFEEVARVLKPKGYFIVTFSNRWFPPKVIQIWTDIHEFERLGLVLEYFLQSDQYQHLGTYSVRNYPRPIDDKYSHQTLQSDPVFAVYGQKLN
jgi:FKBP-type peptidyl-prolyl cis-trans isomerase 2